MERTSNLRCLGSRFDEEVSFRNLRCRHTRHWEGRSSLVQDRVSFNSSREGRSSLVSGSSVIPQHNQRGKSACVSSISHVLLKTLVPELLER